MAEKLNVTRKVALENAIALVRAANLTDDTEKALQRMLDQLSKPRVATVSKARKANESLARKVAPLLSAEGSSTKDVVNLGMVEIMTTQKASAVLRVAVELGLAEKFTDEHKKVKYRPAEMADADSE